MDDYTYIHEMDACGDYLFEMENHMKLDSR